MNDGLNPVAYGGLNAAGEVDLSVESGQQLNCLQPSIVFNNRTSVAHKLVSEVLEGVTKFLEAASGFGRDPASNHGSPMAGRSFRQKREMTFLQGPPYIFHGRRILGFWGMYVFDPTQLQLGFCVGCGVPICLQEKRRGFGFQSIM